MSGFTPEEFAKFVAFAKRMEQEEPKQKSRVTEIFETLEKPAKATPFRDDTDEEEVEINLKNDFLIQERLYLMLSQSKFYEAVSLCDELSKVDNTDIGMKLLKAECYIQLGRETKAEKAINEVEKILMVLELCNIEDVMELAYSFIGNKNQVRALILLRIAADMFKKSPTLPPDDKVGGIFRCIRKMVDPILEMLNPEEAASPENMTGMLQQYLRALTTGEEIPIPPTPEKKTGTKKSERARVIALDYGIEAMDYMLFSMGKVKDAEPENLALKQVICCNFIGKQYSTAGHREKAVKTLKKGVKKYEDFFGDRANQHQAYVTILSNIGAELHNSEKYKESEFYKLKALDAVEYVLDFNLDEEGRVESRRLRESLKVTRNHMRLA